MARAHLFAHIVCATISNMRALVLCLATCLLLACGGSAATPSRPAATPESSTREGFIQVPGGRVWYRIVGDGPGIPLLVVHGGPGSPSVYLGPLEALGSERPVIFYDQLGCGHSERPTDETLWTLDRASAELESVREALGLTRMHLFGHSWGSMLALDHALAHPDGIASLVLAGPIVSATRWNADGERMLSEMPADTQAVLRDALATGKTPSAHPEVRRALIQYFDRHMYLRANPDDPLPPAMVAADNGFGEEQYNLMWGPLDLRITGRLADFERADRLKELRMPTLFTCGRYDEATPEAAEEFRALVPGAALVVFEHSAHMTMLEETELYVKVLRDFLARAEAGAARSPGG